MQALIETARVGSAYCDSLKNANTEENGRSGDTASNKATAPLTWAAASELLLGYTLDVPNRWSVGANFVSYNFPGAEGLFDYDYFEYSLGSWKIIRLLPFIYHLTVTRHTVQL